MLEKINHNRSAIVLGTLVLFLLLFVFYMFGVKPSLDKSAQQEEEILRLERQNTLIQNKIEEIRSKSDSSDPAFQKAREALPLTENTEQLILDLKRVGQQSYAKLVDVEFQLQDDNQIARITGNSSTAYNSIKEVKMKAILEGGYNDIREWMKRVQALPRLITIDSFSFQQPYEQRNPGSILTANISFTAYYSDTPAAKK